MAAKSIYIGGTIRSRTGLQSFAGFCITDLPWRQSRRKLRHYRENGEKANKISDFIYTGMFLGDSYSYLGIYPKKEKHGEDIHENHTRALPV